MSGACIALDPGTLLSAICVLQGDKILGFSKSSNGEILTALKKYRKDLDNVPLVIEQIVSYGNIIGQTTLETVFWSGRFAEAYGMNLVVRIPRIDVKMFICHSPKAKDANIRQGIIDLYGGQDKAIGTKKMGYGPLKGISNDVWAALGLGLTFLGGGYGGDKGKL